MHARILLGVLSVAVAACGDGGGAPGGAGSPAGSGATLYVLDGLQLPMQRSDFADDLNGDGALDNQYGLVEGSLSSQQDDGSVDVAAMLATCSYRAVVEIAPEDGALAVRFRASMSSPVSTLRGSFDGRRFVSARARGGGVPVEATAFVPVFSHSDPVQVPLTALEMELISDGGGFSGQLHAAVPPTVDVRPVAWRAFTQMLQSEPGQHDALVSEMDTNHDGTVSLDEFEHDPILQVLLAPDVQLFDAAGNFAPSPENHDKDSISVGVGFHLRPCSEQELTDGACSEDCKVP
jgi:hypothetical protein